MESSTIDDAITDLMIVLGLLVRRMRAAAGVHELSWTESIVMARLAKGGPATTADLARAESMKPQSMGSTIAALEERGFVERRPHPTDGRQVTIELTDAGHAVRQSAKDAKKAWLTNAISQLSDQERKSLFEAGEIIKRLVE